MKITVAKSDLLNAQKAVAPCRSGTGSDLSTHYLFKVLPPASNAEDAPPTLEIAAYSGQTFASAPVQGVTIEGDNLEDFTVEGWRLEQFLAAVPDNGKALTFSYDSSESKTVEAKAASKNALLFTSLDPSGFPSWDTVIGKSTVTATLPARLLHSILSYVKDFVGNDETKHPEQTVIESRNGVLYGMNSTQAVQVRCPALKGSTLRIHGKDVKGILTFLSNLRDADVDLLEDLPKSGSGDKEPTTLILRQHQSDPNLPTAIYGENRFTTPFPDLGPPGATDQHLWSFAKNEVLEALPLLEADAREKETKLRISRQDDVVKLSMQRPSDSWTVQEISSNDPVSSSDAPNLPGEGFKVNKDAFKAALMAMSGDSPTVGLNKLSRGGYLRFSREEGPRGERLLDGKIDGVEVALENRTTYMTVVAWIK